MRYRYIILLLLGCLAFASNADAQRFRRMRKADAYFAKFNLDKAIDKYKKILDKKPDYYPAERKIADAYRLKDSTQQAQYWYGQAIKDMRADSLAFYYYAQELRDNGQYDSARQAYLEYVKRAPNDPRGLMLANAMDSVAFLKKDSLMYDVKLVPNINSSYSDFSPAYFMDSSLVFSSARNTKKKKNMWTDQPFYDLYVAFKTDSGFKAPAPLPGKVNRVYDQGPVTFANDTVMYFTRDHYVKRRKKQTDEGDVMRMMIMKSTMTSKGWQDLDILKLDNVDYSVEYPSITADGKHLYFSSDMPGGYGGFDLYVTDIFSDGTYGKPKNLGPGVNTGGQEGFPFINKTGDTLYFASDAYIGLGGLDIYYATQTDGNWGNVHNVGYPINTSFDDFGLILDKSGTKGYFTSNRAGGVGSDDIYSWQVALLLKGLVYDTLTGLPIDSSIVQLIQGNDTIGTVFTDKKGEFLFKVNKGKIYHIVASKDEYVPNSRDVNADTLTNNSPPVRIPLKKAKLELVGTTYEDNVDTTTNVETRIGKLAGVMVKLENLNTGEVDFMASDSNGGFHFPLKPNTKYKLTGDKYLYFLKNEVDLDTKGKYGAQTAELDLYKLTAGMTIRLENIYYDFDKYNIRQDAATELDRLYKLMIKYPDMAIEMRSHTDCRGTDEYNMDLSTRRAEAAVEYLLKKNKKEKGSLEDRITAKGFGKTMPIYPDLCKNGEKLDSELPKEIVRQHAKNRRTEFYVVKQPQAIHVENSPSNLTPH